MKFVGVTSCTVGMAHTYMTAEALEKYFRGMGHECHIERDGNLGPESPLEPDEIEEADAIILAVSGSIEEPERFEGYEDKTVSLSVQEGLRHPEVVVEMLKERGLWDES